MPNEGQDEIYFPYSRIRDIQRDMISDVNNSIKGKKHIIMHAPTGIGKTAAALAPALSHAIRNNLTIFFLTSRQTQHKIAIDTLRHIKQKFGIEFGCADIIGKKWMCLQNGVEAMPSGLFHEYCKDLREGGKCEFYTNTRKLTSRPTVAATHAVEELKLIGPCHVSGFIENGKRNKLCPYELAALAATNARIIIADYYYIFNSAIRNSFLLKISKELGNIVLIVDEAHNLPNRIRELLTQKTSSLVIESAKKEANRYGLHETLQNLEIVENALFDIAKGIETENTVAKSDFVESISKHKNYDDLAAELSFAGEDIRNRQKKSFILGIAKFLEAWLGSDVGFGRIITKDTSDKKLKISLSYRCLDPSIAAKEVIEKSYSTVLMSGTLTPTEMYRDILGFKDDIVEKEYKNPFPKRNRLNLIVPKTTTKFVERSIRQFSEIAAICADIAGLIDGNIAVFFPSYDLMASIAEHFRQKCQKQVFIEKQSHSKKEKEELLAAFKNHKQAVLMGISTGSFGEGIDMPGVLKAVIIVGLPLEKPDIEKRLLIEYYDDKFGRGFEYGYVLPAITKCLQNAGRCIRSETDKGAIIFLDERYAWRNYHQCFPDDWDMEVSENYKEILEEFFGR
jgi:DNA excision repair protein ERCC-2